MDAIGRERLSASTIFTLRILHDKYKDSVSIKVGWWGGGAPGSRGSVADAGVDAIGRVRLSASTTFTLRVLNNKYTDSVSIKVGWWWGEHLGRVVQ